VAAETAGDGQGLLAQVAVGRLGMRLLTEPELPLDTIQGEVARAIAALDQADPTDMLNLRAGALLDLAETAALGGRPDEAATAAAAALPLYERKGNRVAAAAVRARLDLAEPAARLTRHAG
jgi:hypothetical protein